MTGVSASARTAEILERLAATRSGSGGPSTRTARSSGSSLPVLPDGRLQRRGLVQEGPVYETRTVHSGTENHVLPDTGLHAEFKGLLCVTCPHEDAHGRWHDCPEAHGISTDSCNVIEFADDSTEPMLQEGTWPRVDHGRTSLQGYGIFALQLSSELSLERAVYSEDDWPL